jgi:uncharacterized protein (DUF1501 family)
MRLSRRSFLSALAATTGTATLTGGLGGMAARAADVSGYRALVCVMLKGGQDCHDLILPVDQQSHDRLSEIRSSLFGDVTSTWRARNRLLELEPLDNARFGPRAFGLPEHMQPLHALFQNGHASIIGNVGPLIEPTDRASWDDRSASRPAKLFSHNDQQSTWMAGATEGARFGWGGRIADAAIASNANMEPAFTAVSVAGNDVFLAGETAQPFQLSSSGPSQLNEVAGNSFLGSNGLPAIIENHLRAIQNDSASLFARDYSAVMTRSLDANATLVGAISETRPFSTVFPATSLGQQLEMVVRMIAERGPLSLQRQVFFVSTGGYDTHANQNISLVQLQTELAEAIGAYYDALVQIGAQNESVLFTASDFGRTLAVNGSGTDHGWGSHHFVVGGGVNGRRIFGDIPPCDFDHAQDAGRGRLIPTLAVDQYASTMAAWFGLNDSERRAVVPNVSAFAEEVIPFL